MFRQLQVPSNAMLRRKKWPKKGKLRKPAEPSITTPGYTRRHFEELKHSIWEFTRTSQSNNRLNHGRELERHEIDQQSTRLIQGMYPADDPKSYELLAQVECPMYDGYWEKRADEKAFLEREHQIELFTFSKSRQILSRTQRRNWPGCIVMLDIERNEFVVPRISRLALQQVNYLDFVRSVLLANPLENISRFTMQELWVAVVTKIYHFEDTVDKEIKIAETNECTPAEYGALAEDYRSAYEVAKARVEARWLLQEETKREREETASEEGRADDSDDLLEEEEQGGHDPGKRQKTQEFRGYVQVKGTRDEAEAQHLRTEHEDVGAFHFHWAAWQDLGGEKGEPATFQFADTSLAFRFKG